MAALKGDLHGATAKSELLASRPHRTSHPSPRGESDISSFSPSRRPLATPEPRPALGSTPRLALALVVALSVSACQFEGYTPTETDPPTLEVPTFPLALGESSRRELDCPAGNCQVRFRMMIEHPGELFVSLHPRHSGDNIGIIIVLEDSIGRVLDRYNMQDEKPPLIVRGSVQPGPHTVLVQAIGGRLTFDIAAQLRVGGPRLAFDRPHRRLQPAAPTRAAYGAGSAHDPRIDFGPLRRFAFAENPEERIDATAPGHSVGNPFRDREIQLALRAELAERGYFESSPAEADFLVDLSVDGQSSTLYVFGGLLINHSYDYYFQTWNAHGGNVIAHSYAQGTLRIDLIDPKSGELIWHGWSTESIGVFGDQKDIIREFVKAVLDTFPPN